MPNIGEQFVKDFAEYYHNGLKTIDKSISDVLKVQMNPIYINK